MSSLKFGTSGLRGLVTELPDTVCAAYTRAFLNHMKGTYGFDSGGSLLVGYDLRSSSPSMAAACMAAAEACGATVKNCGPIPTPALAYHALKLRAPAIMVTGSHIPADRNGLKFYRPDGEIDKSDEDGIVSHLDLNSTTPRTPAGDFPISSEAIDDYFRRCLALLPSNALADRRIGVYQHSSVARDLIVNTLQALGADAVALNRSDVFVPVDTEALGPEEVALAEKVAREQELDGLVSTDGDADRPLIADERGSFLRGDTIGLLTAQFLKADAVVTPVTSNTSVELSGLFPKVIRTRVGSPYVIEGMELARKERFERIVGFEANGGVLLGSSISVDNGEIQALPTRDSMLPILAVLGAAARDNVALSQLSDGLPQRFTRSGRIEHVDARLSGPFLQRLTDEDYRSDFFSSLGPIRDHDAIDGIRTVLETGAVVHFRASGNAPELRCYAEADKDERAISLLQWGLNRAKAILGFDIT